MAKFDAAINRLFNRIFVCKNCKTKVKTDMSRVLMRKISCKNCGSKHFRPIKKNR